MTQKWRRINVDATWWRSIDVDTTLFWYQCPLGTLLYYFDGMNLCTSSKSKRRQLFASCIPTGVCFCDKQYCCISHIKFNAGIVSRREGAEGSGVGVGLIQISALASCSLTDNVNRCCIKKKKAYCKLKFHAMYIIRLQTWYKPSFMYMNTLWLKKY